jgi:hypothetical protein
MMESRRSQSRLPKARGRMGDAEDGPTGTMVNIRDCSRQMRFGKATAGPLLRLGCEFVLGHDSPECK